MRVLMVGTTHENGSLPAYLDTLSVPLEALGASVHRVGVPDIPLDRTGRNFWDANRIEATARALLDEVVLTDYDIISIHFGNYEVEQLLPALWRDLPRPPVVQHVHHVDWSLFKENVPDQERYHQVKEGFFEADGFVHFCTYSRDVFGEMQPSSTPSIVSYSPSAPAGVSPHLTLDDVVGAPIGWSEPNAPLVSMCGFVNPWKNVRSLLEAIRLLDRPIRVLLAGPGWDDSERIGVDLSDAMLPLIRQEGKAEVAVLPSFLDDSQRDALVRASTAGVFPYTPHATFQGSGAVTAYLSCGVPVVATDVGSFRELVGDAGCVVEADDPESFARGLEDICFPSPKADAARVAAQDRAVMFSPERHAAECLEFYERVAQIAT